MNTVQIRRVVLGVSLMAALGLRLSESFRDAPGTEVVMARAPTGPAADFEVASQQSPERPAAAAATGSVPLASADSSIRLRPILDESVEEIFVPPPPPVAVAPTLPPVAVVVAPPVAQRVPAPKPPKPPAVVNVPPAFPYRVIGRFSDAKRSMVFLVGGRGTLAIAAGETLDSGWKATAVRDHDLTVVHTAGGTSASINVVIPQ